MDYAVSSGQDCGLYPQASTIDSIDTLRIAWWILLCPQDMTATLATTPILFTLATGKGQLVKIDIFGDSLPQWQLGLLALEPATRSQVDAWFDYT